MYVYNVCILACNIPTCIMCFTIGRSVWLCLHTNSRQVAEAGMGFCGLHTFLPPPFLLFCIGHLFPTGRVCGPCQPPQCCEFGWSCSFLFWQCATAVEKGQYCRGQRSCMPPPPRGCVLSDASHIVCFIILKMTWVARYLWHVKHFTHTNQLGSVLPTFRHTFFIMLRTCFVCVCMHVGMWLCCLCVCVCVCVCVFKVQSVCVCVIVCAVSSCGPDTEASVGWV